MVRVVLDVYDGCYVCTVSSLTTHLILHVATSRNTDVGGV